MMFDGEALGKQMVDIVRQHVAGALAPLLKRLDALEAKAVPVAAVIDHAGSLLLTLSDGSTKTVGPVVGRDGIDAKGKDGADGLGFDDLDVTHDGERGITLRFTRGDHVKEFAFTLPVVIDRGVWSEARDGGYAKGDGVTWAGSFWISQRDGNTDKPDGGDGWRLSVKRGRDGKAGKDSVTAGL